MSQNLWTKHYQEKNENRKKKLDKDLKIFLMKRKKKKVKIWSWTIKKSTRKWKGTASWIQKKDFNMRKNVTTTGLAPNAIWLVNKPSTIFPNWSNDVAVFWVLISTPRLTVSYYHVTYEFQTESTFYSFPEYQQNPSSKQAPYLKF